MQQTIFSYLSYHFFGNIIYSILDDIYNTYQTTYSHLVPGCWWRGYS